MDDRMVEKRSKIATILAVLSRVRNFWQRLLNFVGF